MHIIGVRKWLSVELWYVPTVHMSVPTYIHMYVCMYSMNALTGAMRCDHSQYLHVCICMLVEQRTTALEHCVGMGCPTPSP